MLVTVTKTSEKTRYVCSGVLVSEVCRVLSVDFVCREESAGACLFVVVFPFSLKITRSMWCSFYGREKRGVKNEEAPPPSKNLERPCARTSMEMPLLLRLLFSVVYSPCIPT